VQAYRLERPLAPAMKRGERASYAAVEGGEDYGRRQHHGRQGGTSGGLAVGNASGADGDGVGGCGSGKGVAHVRGGAAIVAGAAPTAVSASLMDSPSINADTIAGGSGGGSSGMCANDGKDGSRRENSEEKDQPFWWKPAAATTAGASSADSREGDDGGWEHPAWRRRGTGDAGCAEAALWKGAGTEGVGVAEDVELSSRLPSPISLRVSGESEGGRFCPLFSDAPGTTTIRGVFILFFYCRSFPTRTANNSRPGAASSRQRAVASSFRKHWPGEETGLEFGSHRSAESCNLLAILVRCRSVQ